MRRLYRRYYSNLVAEEVTSAQSRGSQTIKRTYSPTQERGGLTPEEEDEGVEHHISPNEGGGTVSFNGGLDLGQQWVDTRHELNGAVDNEANVNAKEVVTTSHDIKSLLSVASTEAYSEVRGAGSHLEVTPAVGCTAGEGVNSSANSSANSASRPPTNPVAPWYLFTSDTDFIMAL